MSYEELVLGDPLIDPATGLPVTRLDDGVPMIVRGPALVETMARRTPRAMARKSRLTEILFGETLQGRRRRRAPRTRTRRPTAPDHATLLNAAEKRLITEWMDLGGQYYNDPFDAERRAHGRRR